jgi:hypothetical protein
MDRKAKIEKKTVIGKSIDLGNGRYKDNEIDQLYDFTTNKEVHNGRSKTVKNEFTSFSSDGKYSRKEQTTYTMKNDDKGFRIEENYSYKDDDGQSGNYDSEHINARDILNIFKAIFNK